MKAVSTENSDSKKRSFNGIFLYTRGTTPFASSPLQDLEAHALSGRLPRCRPSAFRSLARMLPVCQGKARFRAKIKHFRGYQDLAEGLQSKARRLSFRQLCRQLSSKAVIRQKAVFNSFQSLFTNVLPIATFLNECTETIWRTDNSLPQSALPPFISRQGLST